MNFTVTSNKPLDLEVFMTFAGLTRRTAWSFKMKLSGYELATFVIVGRLPQEVTSLELAYNGMRYSHPILIDGQNLKTIDITNGRDYWVQMLREAALTSDWSE